MIEIIPAIDIIDGKCVRLTKGDYDSSKVYGDSPADMARRFEDAGCRRLHVVDLDGAKSSHIVNYSALESIAKSTNLIVDFGGGIKSDDDVRIAFECGARMITGGSVAVKAPNTFLQWLSRYGSDSIILGADVRDGFVATNGWLDHTDCELLEFVAHFHGHGVRQVISTDISVDGTLEGPSEAIYQKLMQRFPDMLFIASGGVGSLDHIMRLDEIGVKQVIVGKAIYEGKITMSDLTRLALC